MSSKAKEKSNRGPLPRGGLLGRGRQRPDVSDNPLLERAQEWILRHNVEHLYGPERVDYETHELVVLVLLRNGRPYVTDFIEHYTSLGAKHLVFMDNGSTDGTVEALKEYDNVTVLRSTLPFKRYQLLMKRYLIERFGRGRWTLSVDMDELFDYPYSDTVDLKALLGYLNENSYTAVVSHMLDMFPERPLSADDPIVEGESLKEVHRFYDISNMRPLSYRDIGNIGNIGNVLASEEIELLKGGVQERLFPGLHPLLTKHPLIFLDDKLRPMDLSEHWAGNARIADFTGVLLHYKLSSNLYGLVRREIEERRYVNRHHKYDKYLKVLEKAPSLLIRNDTSRELKSVNELVGSRVVSVSREYMRFVESEERRSGRYSEGNRSEMLLEAFFNARAEVKTRSDVSRDLQERVTRLRGEVQKAQERHQRLGERLQEAQERYRRLEKRSRRAHEKQQRLEERLQKAQEEQERHRRLKKRFQNLQKIARKRQRSLKMRARRAEEQLRTIQSSRSYKAWAMLGRVKIRARGLLGRGEGRARKERA